MNEIVNKYLLAGGKFMPELHLKQPVFTYIACGPFTKSKERIEKFDGYQRGLASMVYKFFNKKSSGSGVATEPNYQPAKNYIGRL